MTAPLPNGGAVPLHTRAPAPAYAPGSAQGRQDAEHGGDPVRTVFLPELAPARIDAPISRVGAFFGGAA